MHTKQLDFFFFILDPIKEKVLLLSWKKLGTHTHYHYLGVKMGPKRKKKIFPGLLPYFQSVSVKMKIIRTVSLNV